MTDEDVRALLRQLRDEPVPTDSLARVRMAVAERSQIRTGIRRFALPWKFAGVLAATAVVMLVAVLLRPSQPSASPTVKVRESIAAIQVSPPAVVKSERRTTVVSAPARPKEKHRSSATEKGDSVVVRIETSDPDVVILLVGD